MNTAAQVFTPSLSVTAQEFSPVSVSMPFQSESSLATDQWFSDAYPDPASVSAPFFNSQSDLFMHGPSARFQRHSAMNFAADSRHSYLAGPNISQPIVSASIPFSSQQYFPPSAP